MNKKEKMICFPEEEVRHLIFELLRYADMREAEAKYMRKRVKILNKGLRDSFKKQGLVNYHESD